MVMIPRMPRRKTYGAARPGGYSPKPKFKNVRSYWLGAYPSDKPFLDICKIYLDTNYSGVSRMVGGGSEHVYAQFATEADADAFAAWLLTEHSFVALTSDQKWGFSPMPCAAS